MVRNWVGLFLILTIASLVERVRGHLTAWHPSMWCFDGTNPGHVDYDNIDPVQPLYQLQEKDWWFHHINKCDEFPPQKDAFLELPANGHFTVEHAVNRAFTSLSYDGTRAKLYGDGKDHGPDFGISDDGKYGNDSCITEPNIHTQNETMAAGTAFAISYVSDLKKVTQDNLVVFTVLKNTPWRRIATFQVPNLPACPPDGCICAWGWVPNGCGIPNMYMLPYRCKVTGTTGSAAVGSGVPPAWCEDDPKKCVNGPKQMVYWNQLSGNNVRVAGFDLSGQNRSPGYNTKMGFQDGAQRDIFMKDGTATVQQVPTSDPQPYPTSTKSSSYALNPAFPAIWASMGSIFIFLWT